MKKILITGGAGFIGSHLCERLLDEGRAEVICLDNLFTGRKANIEHLTDRYNFRFIERDVTEPVIMDVDEIYHLACPASPKHYQKDPIKTAKTNFLGALNMLELAKSKGARFLLASTSEIYGNPEIHPQTEAYWGNVNPVGVRSCYDEGKRIAETLTMDFHRLHKLPVKIVRIFNTYGPRMQRDDGRVVSNFIVQGLLGEPLSIYGKGHQSRSFCYVEDMVEGLFRMMNHTQFIGPVNIGNSEEFTISDFADTVERLIGRPCQKLFKPLPEDDPQRRKPDIRLVLELIDWRPRISLEEGLKRTVAYFKKELSMGK